MKERCFFDDEDDHEEDPPSLAVVYPSREMPSIHTSKEGQVPEAVGREENEEKEYSLYSDDESNDDPSAGPHILNTLVDKPEDPGQGQEAFDCSMIDRIDLELEEGEEELAKVLQDIYNSDENFRNAVTPIFSRLKDVNMAIPLKLLNLKDPPASQHNVRVEEVEEEEDDDDDEDDRKLPARSDAQRSDDCIATRETQHEVSEVPSELPGRPIGLVFGNTMKSRDFFRKNEERKSIMEEDMNDYISKSKKFRRTKFPEFPPREDVDDVTPKKGKSHLPKSCAPYLRSVPGTHIDDICRSSQLRRSASSNRQCEQTQKIISNADYCVSKEPFRDSSANKTLRRISKDDNSLSSSSGSSDYSNDSSDSTSTRPRRRKSYRKNLALVVKRLRPPSITSL
jgi:hypothetical protein